LQYNEIVQPIDSIFGYLLHYLFPFVNAKKVTDSLINLTHFKNYLFTINQFNRNKGQSFGAQLTIPVFNGFSVKIQSFSCKNCCLLKYVIFFSIQNHSF
jgi:hypothetical protein